jgi:tRNA dimethylallyltransferase
LNVTDKPKIIAVVGPTASGKTRIAIEVAKSLNGEVVSADSRLVYKDFNIGTAKPTLEEMSGIPHYLVDVESPTVTYTVSRYKQEADTKIKEILAKGKVPIIAGGTGFYIKALLEGLNIPDVDPNEDFRQEMENFVKTQGKEALYKKLQESDPVMAAKLMSNDSFRIIRALEVQNATGQKMSEIQTMSEPEYNVLYFGLNAEEREFLYERINRRVLIMLEQGLIKEVENLIQKYGRTAPLLKTLGYREICDYLDGMFSLEETIAKIQQNTRKFAKRQLTWFRANNKIKWFFIDRMDSEEIVNEIISSFSTM